MKPFLAVDIGNSGVKYGVFEKCAKNHVEPNVIWRDRPEDFRRHLRESERLTWWISSVHRDYLKSVTDWIAQHRPGDRVRVLTDADVPLETSVPEPQRLGIDRMLAAYAARRWALERAENSVTDSLLICDLGTAITLDLVSPEGVLEGGAIVPGFSMMIQSLAKGADLIPELHVSFEEIVELDFPGKNTYEAISGGALWSIVGTIRQCYELVRKRHPNSNPLLLLTGEIAPMIARRLNDESVYVFPNLVLSGIASVAELK